MRKSRQCKMIASQPTPPGEVRQHTVNLAPSILMRLRTYLCAASFLCAHVLHAEDTSGGSAPASGGAADSGSNSNPSTTAPSGTGAETGTGNGAGNANGNTTGAGSGTGTSPEKPAFHSSETPAKPAPFGGGGTGAFGSGQGAPGSGRTGLFEGGGTGDNSGTGSNPTGAGTSFGAPSASPGDAGAAPGVTTKPAVTAPGESFQSSTGSATAFGGGGVTAPAEALPTFTLPTAYGQVPQTLVPGAGRLSRPVFRYSVSEQAGFNDNVLQAPTNPVNQSAVYQQVLVSRGTPERVIVVENPPPAIPSLGLNPPPTFRRVTIPAVQPVFKRVLLRPAFHGQSRIGSFVFRTALSSDIQFATKRTLFTLDLRLNGDAYTNRPGKPFDPNGTLILAFVHKLTPRAEVSATAGVNYASQLNTALLNVAQTANSSYLDANARINLSYRWTKRFTTVTSVSFDEIHYESSLQRGANNSSITLGNEARYLLSPRFTGVGEVRYIIQQFPENSTANNSILSLLIGGDLALSSRFSTTVRVGESIQTFDESGSQGGSPFFENSISWRYSPTGYASLNTRYGFENAGLANSHSKSFRSGLTVVQAFGKRLKASLGTTYVNLTSSSSSANSSITENSFQASIGMEYVMTPHLSFNGNASFVDVINSTPNTDFFQNQIFLGFAYTF